MNRKIELTSKVLEILNPNHSARDLKRAIYEWWENPRTKDKGGFQLTEAGFNALVSADIKYYRIKIEEKIKVKDTKTILWLDRYIDCPFYIHLSQVYVFDERTAVQLMLFSGNIYKMIRAAQKFQEKQT